MLPAIIIVLNVFTFFGGLVTMYNGAKIGDGTGFMFIILGASLTGLGLLQLTNTLVNFI